MHPLWTHDFTIISLGTVISMLGNAISGFAISLLVLDYTGSTFLYVLFMVCYQLPHLIVPLVAGPFLDRVSRKKVIYRLDFLSAGVYLLLGVLIAGQFFNYVLLLFVSLLIGSIDSVYVVAYDSFYPNLISEGNFTKAYSISSMIYPLAQVMLPVASIIYETMGTVAPLFLFNAVTFFIAACFERRIRYHETHMAAAQKAAIAGVSRFWGDFKEGVAYLKSEPGLLVITAYFCISTMASNGAAALHLPFFRSHAALFAAIPISAVTLYAIVSNFGPVGRLAGGLIHYRFRYPTEKKFAIALFVYVTYCFLDMSLLFLPVPLMALCMLLSGILGVTSFNIRISATQDYVPDGKRARFNSTFMVAVTAGGIVGQLTAGGLAEYLPERGIIVGLMAINLLAAVFLMGGNAKHVKPIYNRQA